MSLPECGTCCTERVRLGGRPTSQNEEGLGETHSISERIRLILMLFSNIDAVVDSCRASIGKVKRIENNRDIPSRSFNQANPCMCSFQRGFRLEKPSSRVKDVELALETSMSSSHQ